VAERRKVLELVGDVLAGAEMYARQQFAKATLPATVRERDRLIARHLKAFTADLAEYFNAMADRVGARVAKAVEPDLDWKAEAAALRKILGRWYDVYGKAAYEAVSELVSVELVWDAEAPGVRRVIDQLGRQVSGINEATRELLAARIAAGIEQGYSVDQIVVGVADAGFEGLRDMVAGWGEARAQTIALTESANAFNLASVAGYRDSGIVEQVEVFDGTGDAECAQANGSTWTLDQATKDPIAHPNCQRAFGPIVTR